MTNYNCDFRITGKTGGNRRRLLGITKFVTKDDLDFFTLNAAARINLIGFKQGSILDPFTKRG